MKLNLKFLDEARIIAGLNKRALAREAGVSESTIYRLFEGKGRSPALVKRVCEVLGVPTRDAYGVNRNEGK